MNKHGAQNTGKTIKRILSYMKKYKFRFIFVLICILLSAVANVAGSMFIGTLIDDYITPLLGSTNPVFTGLLKAICVMGIVYLVGILATLFYNRTMVSIAQGVLKKIRDDMFTHMQKLPIKYFDTHTHGDIMSYYTNDTDTLRQMMAQSIPQMFSSAVTIISVVVAMFISNVYLAIFVLVFATCMMFVTKKIAGASGRFFVKQQQSIGKVNGYIEEMINGQKVVKVFCHEEHSKEDFDKINEELCENATEANKYANILMPIMANLGNLQYVLIAIIGGALALNGVAGLTLGVIASFLQLSKSFTMPINQISQQLNSIVMALAGAKRIFDLLDEKPEVDDGYVTLVNVKEENGKLVESKKRTGRWAWKHFHKATGKTDYIELKGDIVLDGVDFGYRDDKIVLHDVRMYAKPGQKIAFVGSTGAGKTTIINLINRFYEIQSGTITYDGIDIRRIKKDDLRKSLSMVIQDTHLFTGTIAENIRYGRLNATEDEVRAAAKIANADSFIRRLPKGYDTILHSDGSNLSQGQRQLLAIARAAISRPPVLILDEATSSIDTRTERLIEKGMDRLMENRTVFVIAHRLSTVRNSKAILVLEKGTIIERGDHEELLGQKGRYYQLYTGQFELE